MGQSPGSADQPRAIVVDYEFPQPAARVWRALTDPEWLAQWLMPGDIRPLVGHRFTLRAQPVPGWDGVCHCEVLAVEPERLLRYTWRGGAEGYGHVLDTVVTWTLAPTASGGTHLRLAHDGFTADDAFGFETMGNGWRTHAGRRLARVLASVV